MYGLKALRKIWPVVIAVVELEAMRVAVMVTTRNGRGFGECTQFGWIKVTKEAPGKEAIASCFYGFRKVKSLDIGS